VGSSRVDFGDDVSEQADCRGGGVGFSEIFEDVDLVRDALELPQALEASVVTWRVDEVGLELEACGERHYAFIRNQDLALRLQVQLVFHQERMVRRLSWPVQAQQVFRPQLLPPSTCSWLTTTLRSHSFSPFSTTR